MTVYYYISLLGEVGIKHASEMPLINANYIAQQLEPRYSIPYKNRYGLVSHELILKTDNLENGITEKDIAKRLNGLWISCTNYVLVCSFLL